MKKQIFKFISLLLATIMLVSLVGCEINDKEDYAPSGDCPSPDYGIVYSAILGSSYSSFGCADYGSEIPMTIILNKHPNVMITILESEYYEIIGPSEFNTNDYTFDEDNKQLNIDFKVKITKESDGVKAVKIRFTCLCGEEDCGRFKWVSYGHYYDDTFNFGFIANEKGVFLANNHGNIEGYNEYNLWQFSK